MDDAVKEQRAFTEGEQTPELGPVAEPWRVPLQSSGKLAGPPYRRQLSKPSQEDP